MKKSVCPEVSISAPQGTTKCHKTRRIEYSGTGRRQRTWFSVRTSVGRPNSWRLSFWYRVSYAKSIPRCRGIVYWQSSENQRIRCQVRCGCSVKFSFQSIQITLIVDKIQNQQGFYILVYQAVLQTLSDDEKNSIVCHRHNDICSPISSDQANYWNPA